MKTLTIEKFRGLQVQSNSFQGADGFFEVADNCVISRENIVTHRRGFYSEFYLPENVSVLTDFKGSRFAIGNHVYRFHDAATGTATASGGTAIIYVAATGHGLQDDDWVSSFSVPDESFASAFENRFSDYTGQVQVTVDTNDLFHFSTADNAIAGGTGTASYTYYTMQGGSLFHVGDYVPVLKTGKNLYWGTDEGLHALETVSGDVRKAGVPPALDCDAYLSGVVGGVAPNSQVAYRVVYGRKDANNTLHLSSPSDVVVLSNPTTNQKTVSVATGTNVATVTASGFGLSNGDTIYLYGVLATPSGNTPADGSSVSVTGVSASGFQFDFDDVGVSPTGVSSLDWSTRKTGTVYASIPSEIVSTEYFYQVYRSDSTDATVIPDARYKLVEQISITSADLARGFIGYEDELPFEIIQSNAELYTNPTQEGESQANSRPPLFTDASLFKGFSFFSDCTAYRSRPLTLIQSKDFANLDTVTIAGKTYVFRGDATNSALGNDITTASATGSAGTVTVTSTSHGFVANDSVYLISSTIGATPALKVIGVPTPNTFTFSDAATGTGFVTFEGRTATGGNYLVTLTEPSGSSAETIAEGIDYTARSLVKAINRTVGGTVYAQYVSGVDESPGRILLTSKALDAAEFYATASTTTVGACFNPALPVSGTSVADFLDEATNTIFVSKFLEAEAVPIVNRFPIGSQDSKILRCIALRDSLIVFKEDGVFRLNGDSLSNFASTALDTTVILKAVRSAAVLNNSVYALTNQGVVQVTDTSVRIVSRAIEPLLNSVLGKTNLNNYTSGVAYESDRLYILSTIDVNTDPNYSNIAYVYNYLTDAWTTWTGNALAFSGGITLGDRLAHILAGDRKDVIKERKEISKIDYSGQDSVVQCYVKTIARVSAISGTPTVCIIAVAHTVIVGDVVTISVADTLIASAFTSGASSVNGLRTVTSVTANAICFAAGENSTVSINGQLYWQRGISEIAIAAAVTSGSKDITLTTTVPHGLVNGDAVVVDSLDTTVTAALSNATDLLGYRAIIVVDATNITIKATSNAIGNATGAIVIRDKRGDLRQITVTSAGRPQVGDALISNNKFYKIAEVAPFGTQYIINTQQEIRFTSTDLVYLNEAFSARLKFAPITMGTGTLKTFAEFQAWFRNTISCTQVSVNFGTDSRYSDKKVDWSNFVGTPAGFVSFGGWGSQKWGGFPWGGGTNIELDFESGPSVPLRTWIPQASYLATFIQPEMVHSTAGEPFELQSVTIIGKPATTKVSK